MKSALALLALVALMLAAVAACSKKEEAAALVGETSMTNALVSAKASCNMASQLGTCNEYRRGTSFGVEKSLCERVHGSFRSAGCDASGVIATCAMSDGEIKSYYGKSIAGEHALTVEEARTDCESDALKGVFAVITTQR